MIDDNLFAHRVSRHAAIKYSPFFLSYSRHPILPIDIRYDLVELQEVDDKPYDLDIFQAVLNSALSTKETTHDRASTNIKNTQVKYKRNVVINRCIHN